MAKGKARRLVRKRPARSFMDVLKRWLKARGEELVDTPTDQFGGTISIDTKYGRLQEIEALQQQIQILEYQRRRPQSKAQPRPRWQPE